MAKKTAKSRIVPVCLTLWNHTEDGRTVVVNSAMFPSFSLDPFSQKIEKFDCRRVEWIDGRGSTVANLLALKALVAFQACVGKG